MNIFDNALNMVTRDQLDRRTVLKGIMLGAGAGVLQPFLQRLAAEQGGQANQVRRNQKRLLLIFLNGGMSQFESWDPKPGRATGGPFQSIQTSVPGYRMSELMPKMASSIHRHTAIIRSQLATTGHDDRLIFGGQPKTGPVAYPSLGAMLARELADPNSPLPHHVCLTNYLNVHNYFESAGFLGATWNPVNITPERIPPVAPFITAVSAHSRLQLAPPAISLPAGISDEDHREREAVRDQLNQRFGAGRTRDGVLLSHDGAYRRVRGLMESHKLFDIEQEPLSMRNRYGSTPFGQQALVARRLIEAGVPYVRVNRAWWDHHAQNFESHQEMVPHLDHVLSVLLEDLQERGLLANTLVATFSEMGRTPGINERLGRDHWGFMSVSLSGCGIKPGVVYGSTNENGDEIATNPVSVQQYFATVMRAVGIDHQKEHLNSDGRPIALTDYGTEPIAEVLA